MTRPTPKSTASRKAKANAAASRAAAARKAAASREAAAAREAAAVRDTAVATSPAAATPATAAPQDSNRPAPSNAPGQPAPAATGPAATAATAPAAAPPARTTPARRTSPKRPLLAAATALTLAIAAGYVFVSTTFTFPPASANAASEAVDDAFAPYFSQRWDVFAPNMLKVNSALQIQVQWREDDGLVHSDWVDVTGTELEAVDGNPMPSRIAKSSANAAVAYITRFDELTDAQKSRVQDTFIERTGDGDFQPIPDADLIAELEALGEDDTEGTESAPSPVPLLRYDYMLVRFATAYGEAYFDREIERVRWRVQFDRPNDFEHRGDAERQTPLNELEFGWRQPAAQPSAEAVAIFDDVIERYDR